MGQSADRARMDRQAVEAFEAYLERGDTEPDVRAEIETRLPPLRASVATQETAAARAEMEQRERRQGVGHPRVPTPRETAIAAPIDPPAATEPEAEGSGSATKWIVIGVIAAVLIAGGATAFVLLRDPSVQAPIPPNTGISREALR